jgi:hypothetical protein
MVLGAGLMTFGNEWLQTGKPNWRVPIATLLGAGAIGLIGTLSPSAGNTLGFMVLLAASVTKIGGVSPLQELAKELPQNKGQAPVTSKQVDTQIASTLG